MENCNRATKKSAGLLQFSSPLWASAHGFFRPDHHEPAIFAGSDRARLREAAAGGKIGDYKK